MDADGKSQNLNTRRKERPLKFETNLDLSGNIKNDQKRKHSIYGNTLN